MSIQQLGKLKIIDLSPPINERTPNWPGMWLEFVRTHDFEEHGIAVTQMKISVHIGTHLDGPYHIYDVGKDESPYAKAYEIPLESLVGEAVCLDIPKGEKEGISVRDLENAEKKVPLGIREGDIVMIRTGWETRFDQPDVFLNRHPFIHTDACQWLLDRGIKLLCCDFPDIDNPDTREEEHYPAHRLMFRNNLPLIENHVNLDLVANKRFFYIALPIKLTTTPDGIPLRAIALI